MDRRTAGCSMIYRADTLNSRVRVGPKSSAHFICAINIADPIQRIHTKWPTSSRRTSTSTPSYPSPPPPQPPKSAKPTAQNPSSTTQTRTHPPRPCKTSTTSTSRSSSFYRPPRAPHTTMCAGRGRPRRSARQSTMASDSGCSASWRRGRGMLRDGGGMV